jgi:Terminase large subunit, T4likevirus-type, N-terminal
MLEIRERLVSAWNRVAFAERLGIVPDPWQHDLLRSKADRVLLNCSRQSGKSTMAAIIALHRALFYPGSLVLILAPAERQAKELFAKVSEFYRVLHREVPAPSDRKLGIQLINGSRIEALPGSERTIRGFSGVDLLILDEASRVDDELYFAVRPMLAVSGGAMMMLTTPYGRRGVFYEAWEGDDSDKWERYEVPASSVPRITAEFLDKERRSLPARVFRQEYECSFEETDDAVFSYADIAGAMSDEVTPLFPIAGGH